MNSLWLRIQPSVFSLTFEGAGGRLSSGTGFKVGRHLVTNNHVVQIPGFSRILLRGVGSDGYTTTIDLAFGHLHFRAMLAEGDPETAWDYAVFAIDSPVFQAAPSLELVAHDTVEIGSPVAIFGYQFDNLNLSMHQGYISSQYHRAGVHYLQLDSSINHGNSGGPLVDVRTGKVFGLVTRKATGLTEQFDRLLESFQQNIAVIRASQRSGQMFAGGIDPIAAVLATQAQMQTISKEMARSANVGIGYAYHVKRVRDCIARLTTT